MNKKDLVNRLTKFSIELAGDQEFELAYILNCIGWVITHQLKTKECKHLELLDDVCHSIMNGNSIEVIECDPSIKKSGEDIKKKDSVDDLLSKKNIAAMDSTLELLFTVAQPPNGPKGFM